MPKDKVFYGLFEEVSSVLIEMAGIFTDATKEEDHDKAIQLLKSLKDYEHKNDDITHKIFIELGRNFITPFDREDIHYLATSLDDIADYLWTASNRMIMYSIDHNDAITQKFAQIITQSINQLSTAVRELRDMKNLKSIVDACVKINSIENEGDDLLDKSLVELFKSSLDPKEIIKKKDLYEMLEIVTDKCEDAADIIESIVIKYS